MRQNTITIAGLVALVAATVLYMAMTVFHWQQRRNAELARRPYPFIYNIANGATLSGSVTIPVAGAEYEFQRTMPPRMQIQVDGGEYRMNPPEHYENKEQHEKYVIFTVDTDDYANGPHTLRVTDGKGRADVRKVIFRNTVFGVNTSEGSLSASLAAKQPWTVIVEGSDYKPVRTYRGNSSKIRIKWDGKDANGKIRVNWSDRWNHPPDDSYALRLRIAGEDDRIYTANSISASK